LELPLNPDIKLLARALTYAGALPFAACALALWGGFRLGGLDPVAALKVYSLTIAAFMAGTLWGFVIPGGRGRHGAVLLVVSNVFALAVAGAALLSTPHATLGFDLAAFVLLWAADFWAGRLGWIAPDYLALRLRVTGIVAASLGVAWAAI
jgi:hypothetical protein